MSISDPTFKVLHDKPFRFVMPEGLYFEPCTLSPEQESTVPQVDQIHESLVEIANMLTDNMSVNIDETILNIFSDYVTSTYHIHFYVEEKLMNCFFPEMVNKHRYEHNTLVNRIDGVRLKLIVSPEEAQQYMTNVLLNIILEHFIQYDIPWIDRYKTSVSEEEKIQFLTDVNINKISDAEHIGYFGGDFQTG